MSLHHVWRLRHFLSIAENGSFHAASRALNISQPALTKSIRILEEEFGTALFVRLPRGVCLTEPGETLLVRAREIDAAWNACLVELGGQGRGLGGRIHIGGGPVYSAVYFPQLLAEMHGFFPNLRVSVSIGVGADLLPALKNGDLRAYAGGVPEGSEALGRDFETEVLTMQANSIFASRKHPLVAQDKIEIKDLLKYPWLSLYSGQYASFKIDQFFQKHGLPSPKLSIDAHSLQIGMTMLSEHNFIACMPEPLARCFPNAELKNIGEDDFRWSMATGVSFQKKDAEFPPIRFMLRALKRMTTA
ncbi:LysR family transcriptional regulator [Martelella endophytica]|uniref:LysR family transcriptional regulator n=1 Tax=Martelella endophytica TaxID=1486262 RepID=A0A0D5LM28_MAREN|nr:LysR family transcriptional regulator [Martelella endophytica]AJY44832.1 LysR family transcriptional regulator [Martelella endophytica]